MTRNVESIFGAVVTAPHQIPYTYTATGGEKFISLPFYPVTGVVTVNGSMQVPLDNFEIDGNTLNLGYALSKGDVVFCLFDKILSPEDYKTGIRIYKFQAIGGETEFTPDYTSYGVQSLYIGGEYKTPEIEYSYDSTTGKVTLQTALTAGVWVVAEMSVKQPNISPLFDRSIQEIARATNVKDSEVILSTDTTQSLNGKKVVYSVGEQKAYGLPTLPTDVYINAVSNGQLTYSPGNITVTLLDSYQQQNIRELWRRSLAETGLTLVDGSFEAGGTLVNANDVLLQERTGKAFSGPAGTVAAGTNPASGGFVDKSGVVLAPKLIGESVWHYPVHRNGINDDAPGIQAWINNQVTGIYPEVQGRELLLPWGLTPWVIGSPIDLPPGCILNCQNAAIKPLGNPVALFRIDTRYKGSGNPNAQRFWQGTSVKNFRVWSDRGFGVPTQTTDCSHAVLVLGGWLMRADFENISCDPGVAMKSVIAFDLRHTDPSVSEVGVPDSITFRKVSCLYAENTSFAVSIIGDDTTVGTGCRMGSVTFEHIYGNPINKYDYNDRNASNGYFGGVYIKNVKISSSRVYQIFADTQSVLLDGALCEIGNSKLDYIYSEHNKSYNIRPAVIRGLNGAKIINSDFGLIRLYSEVDKYSESPQMFDVQCFDCNFNRVVADYRNAGAEAGGRWPPTDFFKLQNGSSGNKFHNKILWNYFSVTSDAWSMSRISAPFGNYFPYCNDFGKQTNRMLGNSIPAGTAVRVAKISSKDLDAHSNIRAKCEVQTSTPTTSATLRVNFSGNALNAPISSKLFNLGSADLGSLDITVKTEYLSGVSPTQFATQVAIVVRFSANSGSDKQIFQDVVLKIDTSGELFIDLELVSISGGQSFIQTADSEHWYSTNYVTEIQEG